jgi:aryl-alcohol dehydrogenase-like predicted oxidoreductase
MVGKKERGLPNKLSAAGWPKAAGGGKKSFWQPKFMVEWVRGPMNHTYRLTISARHAKAVCAGFRRTMEVLVQQGKVVYVGSSNFAGWNIAQAQGVAASRHFMGLVSEQSLYNLKARTIELEVIPACRAHGLGIIPWSPLAGGLLGGALQKAQAGRRADDRTQKEIERVRPQLEKYEALCLELGEKPADIALAWLLHNPVVTAPIIGPRTMEQLTGSLRAVEIKLSVETMAALNEIWPGPGGEAPMAYAW